MTQQYPATDGLEVSFLDFDEEIDFSVLDAESVYAHQCPLCGAHAKRDPETHWCHCGACGYIFGRTT